MSIRVKEVIIEMIIEFDLCCRLSSFEFPLILQFRVDNVVYNKRGDINP